MADTKRIKALQFALNNHLSEVINAEEWEKMDEEEAIAAIDGIVWQPFEDYPLGDVVGYIEDMASNLEAIL